VKTSLKEQKSFSTGFGDFTWAKCLLLALFKIRLKGEENELQ
jgi:hypothetical protein